MIHLSPARAQQPHVGFGRRISDGSWWRSRKCSGRRDAGFWDGARAALVLRDSLSVGEKGLNFTTASSHLRHCPEEPGSVIYDRW